MRPTSAIVLSALALAACDDASSTPAATNRHAIAKADLAGGCNVSDCGDQSADGNCWCDTECVAFGDCCANVASVCEAPPAPSCDDDSTLSPYCDIAPVCADGLVKARQHGCFVCVDPATCEAPPAPSCDDDSTLSPYCDIAPVCPDGLEKARQHGCFVCVDPATCAAPN